MDVKCFHITLENQDIEYYIHYKHMKNIRIYVKQGCLHVSAPFGVARNDIENIIMSYEKKLISQICSYQSYSDYQDEGYVMIFNKKYVICLRDVGQYKCKIHDNQLYVYHHNIEKCVMMFLKQMLYDYVVEKVIGYLAYDFDLKMPVIEIKKYQSKWGSCFYRNNKIVLNQSLVHLEQQLIDYVIVHELTHFIEPNHSSRFYKEVEKRMPDYKLRVKKLKEKHI